MNTQAATVRNSHPRVRHWSLIIFVMIALAIMIIPLPARSGGSGSQTLRIAASQYDFSPGVIAVNQGDQITLELRSTDVVHGLYLDDYDLQVTADPGQTASLSFVADKSGTFRFRCSVTCGPLHPFMIGKLKVGNNALFWRGMALAALVEAAGLWRLRR